MSFLDLRIMVKICAVFAYSIRFSASPYNELSVQLVFTVVQGSLFVRFRQVAHSIFPALHRLRQRVA